MTGSKKVLLICILIFALLFGLFVVSRYGEFTTYLPFFGKVFSVDPEQVDALFIQNGTTGEQVFFETAEEKRMMAQELNSLRYLFWVPTIPVAKGGWSYRIAIEADGKQYSYYFSENDMIVNGITYVFTIDQMDALRQYVD